MNKRLAGLGNVVPPGKDHGEVGDLKKQRGIHKDLVNDIGQEPVGDSTRDLMLDKQIPVRLTEDVSVMVDQDLYVP